MKDIINRLTAFWETLQSEKGGLLYFLGIIQRTDSENKWDLLIIADWIKENNSHSDLEYILNNLKLSFEDNLDFLEDIVLYKPEYYFGTELKKANESETFVLKEPNEVKIWDDGYINMIPIHSQISELPNLAVEPVVSQKIADF